MLFENPYLKPKDKMQLLQRWIIVHSIIYYDLNNSIVSDHMYDNNCRQLVALMDKHPNNFKRTKYYKTFKNFDGSTGFDIIKKVGANELQYLTEIAQRLILRYG